MSSHPKKFSGVHPMLSVISSRGIDRATDSNRGYLPSRKKVPQMKNKTLVSAVAVMAMFAAAPVMASDNMYDGSAVSNFASGADANPTGRIINYSQSASGGGATASTRGNTQQDGVVVARTTGFADYSAAAIAADRRNAIVGGSGDAVTEQRTAVSRDGVVRQDEESTTYSRGTFVGGSLTTGGRDRDSMTAAIGGTQGHNAGSARSALRDGHVSSRDAARATNHSAVETAGRVSGHGATSSVSDGSATSQSEASEVENGGPGLQTSPLS